MQLRINRSGVVPALALIAALGGCADMDTQQAWFAKPLDISGRNAGGYSFSELAETKQRRRPITPADLVDANGGCAAPAVAAAPPPPPPGNQPAGSAAPAPEASSLLGSGVDLGMSECDVVFRAGQPSSVQIGNNPSGDRTAVLTFAGGPRAGVYHFERGALVEMDAVAQPAAPPQVAKKKPVKSAKPPKKNAQS